MAPNISIWQISRSAKKTAKLNFLFSNMGYCTSDSNEFFPEITNVRSFDILSRYLFKKMQFVFDILKMSFAK